MPTILFLFGLRFFFYSDERLPMHVHVKNGDGKAKIDIETIKEISSRTGKYDESAKKWVKDETSSNRFGTPQNFANEHNLTDIVEEYPYSKLKYENGCYTIKFEDEDAKGTYTFQFLDKKLISFDALTEEMHEYCNLTYDEITPELPVPDPTI